MPDNLEDLLLSLDQEPEIEVDYSAPESGSFPPQAKPGAYDFIFHLAQDPFGKIVVEGRPYLNVTFTAEVQLPDKPEPVKINFLRASFYKSPNAPAGINSDGAELLRSLGIQLSSHKASELVQALQQADGRARGRLVLGLEFYCKSCEEIVSTSPRRKPRKNGHTDVAWPKDPQGNFEPVVHCPTCGDAGYGRERVVAFKLPRQAAGA